MTTPAFAPYVATYASSTPYITGWDFLNEPTGVDTSQLVPAGSTLTNEAALANLCANASSEADLITQKVLAATLDTVSDEYRIFRDGTLRIPVPYSPIVAVTEVLLGRTQASMAAMTNLSGLFIKRSTVRVPVCGAGSYAGAFSQHPAAHAQPGYMFAQLSYVNGWMHSTLASAVDASAQSLDPAVVLGAIPGLPFTIYDGALTEAAQVSPPYVPGSSAVPLVSALQYPHAAGTSVSALPRHIRGAVVRLASWLVRTRGADAVVLGAITEQPSRTQKIDPGGDDDYAEACRTLIKLRRTW